MTHPEELFSSTDAIPTVSEFVPVPTEAVTEAEWELAHLMNQFRQSSDELDATKAVLSAKLAEIASLERSYEGLSGRYETVSTNYNDRMDVLRDQVRRTREMHEQDIALIGEGLIEVSSRREWCGEFDRFISDANESLHISLPQRTRNYNVEFTMHVTVTVDTAGSEAAEAMAQNIAETLQSRAYHGHNDVTSVYVDDDSFETEVADN